MAQILVIDDNLSLCHLIEKVVKKIAHTAVVAHTLDEGMEKGQAVRPDIVLLDVHLPDANGLEAMEQIRRLPSNPEVIIFTGAGDPDGAEQAIKSGAWDYIEKSTSIQNITAPLLQALEYRAEKCTKAPVFLDRKSIVGGSPQITECLDQVAQAAMGDANVLITGETGTGKEVFAEAIHTNSLRAKNNFVVVDCAALPHELVESILFGHEKGAFTGAEKTRNGLIKHADGGTLFLDEVGELPLDLQKSFLRVLEERRFRPVGSHQQVNSDFRLVAATNRDLETMVQAGKFRGDLLFRIRALPIELPPLRDRSRDVRDLTIHFNDKICDKTGIRPKRFAEDFFDSLLYYPWPGNVRELLHAMEHAVSAARFEKTLFVRHLPNTIRVHLARQGLKTGNGDGMEKPDKGIRLDRPLQDVRNDAVAEVEKRYLNALMQSVVGNVQDACRISGLSRSRLYHLLKTYELNRTV
ncbi:Fis family transcriptional regulator [Desulfosarcina ovata subsp. sediminis]|uniref:Fis family transcriptional regulator n=1 Tax=Desulfosarcina ovata subsp. sediminis TaxID=885957 RepID=A0A5K7ZIL8_9BACT|nr:sigma-54 dependent transcriptional regulator [Desulfosarcina ovata]BBO81972.1 Fis family transcriptional regulator [Desulfosarcina ovata subsp. sediminis]